MGGTPARDTARAPDGDLDALLTAQLLVAWAGETARLGWWRTELVSRYGGLDLFAVLTPQTTHWAVLQAAREAARRHDAERRADGGEPDDMLTLFHLGFDLDEQADERLQHHKRTGKSPTAALPRLTDFIRLPRPDDDDDSDESFDREAFDRHLHGEAARYTLEPGRRRMTGPPPPDLPELVRLLLAGLAPRSNDPDDRKQYPLPYFRRKA